MSVPENFENPLFNNLNTTCIALCPDLSSVMLEYLEINKTLEAAAPKMEALELDSIEETEMLHEGLVKMLSRQESVGEVMAGDTDAIFEKFDSLQTLSEKRGLVNDVLFQFETNLLDSMQLTRDLVALSDIEPDERQSALFATLFAEADQLQAAREERVSQAIEELLHPEEESEPAFEDLVGILQIRRKQLEAEMTAKFTCQGPKRKLSLARPLVRYSCTPVDIEKK